MADYEAFVLQYLSKYDISINTSESFYDMPQTKKLTMICAFKASYGAKGAVGKGRCNRTLDFTKAKSLLKSSQLKILEPFLSKRFGAWIPNDWEFCSRRIGSFYNNFKPEQKESEEEKETEEEKEIEEQNTDSEEILATELNQLKNQLKMIFTSQRLFKDQIDKMQKDHQQLKRKYEQDIDQIREEMNSKFAKLSKELREELNSNLKEVSKKMRICEEEAFTLSSFKKKKN
jgi:hypothetical protein